MEKSVQLRGRHGVIIVVLVALFAVFRFATIGNVEDETLTAAIKAELRNDLGNRLGQALHSGSHDPSTLAAMADGDGIDIYSTAVSKPLLGTGSAVRAVVKVHYALPEQAPQQEYWLFEHSALGGWRYRQRSSAVSYYLNFL